MWLRLLIVEVDLKELGRRCRVHVSLKIPLKVIEYDCENLRFLEVREKQIWSLSVLAESLNFEFMAYH